MKKFIQTRGTGRDYAFLGETPAAWWRKKTYTEGTTFENPTLIFEALEDDAWRCYISGIPSLTRKDQVQRVIRYTLVMEGKVRDTDNNAKALQMIRAALAVFKDSSKDDGLQSWLDKEFDVDFVDEYLATKEGNKDAAQKRIDAVFNHLPNGSSANNEIFKKFVENIDNFLKGNKKGVAARLSFVNDTSYATQILELASQDHEINTKNNCLILLLDTKQGQLFESIFSEAKEENSEKKALEESTGKKNRDLPIKIIPTLIAILVLIILLQEFKST